MADKSWGVSAGAGCRIRTGTPVEDHVAERARARETRAVARAVAVAARADARAIDRATEATAREAARGARRAREQQAASGDPHAAAAARHRSSGRKDVVREQRDTRSYTTIVDVDRMRMLAARGASIGGLAAAFGIDEADVERALR